MGIFARVECDLDGLPNAPKRPKLRRAMPTANITLHALCNFPRRDIIVDTECPLFQLVQMLQPCQDNLLTRLLDLAREEDLVQNGVDLVEVKDQVQLAHVAEEGIQHLDEEMYRLEEGELVVVCVDAGAEEQARVAPVDEFVLPELDEVGLVLLVAGRDEAVNLALELDLLVVAVGSVPLGQAGFASATGLSARAPQRRPRLLGGWNVLAILY